MNLYSEAAAKDGNDPGISAVNRRTMLFISLPSGRKLAYVKPRIEENQFGGESITYCGTDAQKHWTRVESYGPKIVENIIQAVCRDLLADAMKSLRRQFAILMQQYKKGLRT